ncbi:MAG: General stress protein CTC [Anaerolineae bacterium]|nr:General stress protein CTC [Anaerolineae bacterium]
MEALELKAELRQLGKGHAKNLRQQGLVPAVMYGKDKNTELLQIEARSLARVLSVAGTHQLIAVQVANKKPVMTLARDIQKDVIKREYLHVDFYMVQMDQKVEAQIPIRLVGEAPAVDLGGVLTQGLDQLDVECLPGDLVNFIEVDISGLAEFNDTLTVADMVVPSGITVLSDSESMVAKVEPPRIVEEDEAEGEPTSAEPEVISSRPADDEE